MRFLSLAEVLALQQRLIATSGGADGLRDAGALESAVSQPHASFAGKGSLSSPATMNDPNGLAPVLQAQSTNPLELVGVAGHHRQAARQSRRADQDIVGTDWPAPGL